MKPSHLHLLDIYVTFNDRNQEKMVTMGKKGMRMVKWVFGRVNFVFIIVDNSPKKERKRSV